MPATIVLVHGACHGAWCWKKVVPGLVEAGCEVIAPDLPGHAEGSTEPPTDLYGDAAYVRGILDGLEGPVLLVGHSYGGAVITEAAVNHPAVAHLVYLTALMPDTGESIATSAAPGESTPPLASPGGQLMIPTGDGATLILDPERVFDRFYHDCSPEDVEFALQRLSRQTIASLTQPLTGAAWHTIPATYVVHEDDRSLPRPLTTGVRHARGGDGHHLV